MKILSLLAILILAFSIQSIPAFAEIKSITHTIQQPFGGSQSPDDARTAGIARAKREALEQFGTYIESTTVVKNSQVDSDEILALTAGVTKAEVIKQKNYTDGDGFGLEITVKVELDSTVLDNNLTRLLEDRKHLMDFKSASEREKRLLARIAELEKENQQKGSTNQQSAILKEKFQAASKGLSAIDLYKRAFALWDGNKYTDSHKAVEYLTQSITLDPNYANSYHGRGIAYIQLNQFSRAIDDFDLAIRIDPSSAVFTSLSKSYLNLGQYDRAITSCNQAIRLDPQNAMAYNNRGIGYFGIYQFELGCADLKKACQLGICSGYEVPKKSGFCM